MRIVLDSNLYISAFLSKGLASDILLYAEQGTLDIFASEEILQEVQEKLIIKLKLQKNYVKEYIDHIRYVLHMVESTQKLAVVVQDPDDNKIIECAVAASAHIIVSMDKHLLKLKKYNDIGIIHPKTLAWIIPQILE